MLNRDLQFKILTTLAKRYPNPDDLMWSALDIAKEIRDANVQYLIEHGLVRTERGEENGSPGRCLYTYFATAKGMDFLEDDGGISAILGVVTIKLHDDTIKNLLESKVLESELPKPEQQRYIDQIRKLPAEATKHIILKLVDLGLEKGPRAIEMIGRLLPNALGS
ncbi:TPA: hypothetical protein ACKP5X_000474 [Stenotrophomonas maltophilia]